MSPSRPYVMRALYEWILDNDCTPYVLVDAEQTGVDVPRQYVKDGQIVLNVSPAAVVELRIENDAVFFNGRFGGVPVDVHVPMHAVMGIYARENGQGMVFDGEDLPPPEPPTPDGDGSSGNAKSGDKRPALKVVK
ncbi:MAG: ClpXP protease specificity-enhancing factor [Pseudomonadota bacterium]